MRNIDFSDIHKFIFSIGLALIIFAVLIRGYFSEKIIPYLSGGVFLLGLILIISVLFKWNQRIKVMGFDEKIKSAV